MAPNFHVEMKVQWRGGMFFGVVFMDRSVRVCFWPFMLRAGWYW